MIYMGKALWKISSYAISEDSSYCGKNRARKEGELVREGFTEKVTFEPKLKEGEDKKPQVFERKACPGRQSHEAQALRCRCAGVFGQTSRLCGHTAKWARSRAVGEEVGEASESWMKGMLRCVLTNAVHQPFCFKNLTLFLYTLSQGYSVAL